MGFVYDSLATQLVVPSQPVAVVLRSSTPYACDLRLFVVGGRVCVRVCACLF